MAPNLAPAVPTNLAIAMQGQSAELAVVTAVTVAIIIMVPFREMQRVLMAAATATKGLFREMGHAPVVVAATT